MISKILTLYLRFSSGLASRWRNRWYKALGCQIDGYVWLRRVKIPRGWPTIKIGRGVALDEGVTLLASGPKTTAVPKIEIAESVYINQNTFIDASERISIGPETMIGPFCYITDHDHQYAPGDSPGGGTLLSKPTIIGRRVWLGASVTVLKGIHIGDNTIIGAGSIVTKDIPPNAIAVGNPARVKRLR